MSEFEHIKQSIVRQLGSLCAHCATGSHAPHDCPVTRLSNQVQALRGVPLVVDSQFRGVLFAKV